MAKKIPALWSLDDHGKLHLNPHKAQAEIWSATERYLFFIAGTQSGKALALDTPIPTPSGFIEMGKLEIGDQVFDDQGKACRITFATSVMHNRCCYRIEFDDGASLVVDAEHLWEIQTAKQRKNQVRRKQKPDQHFVQARWQCQPTDDYSIVTTEQMLDSIRTTDGRSNYSMRLADPVDYPERELPIPPYTLGAWLGDGTSSAAMITVADKEIVERIESEGTPVSVGHIRTSQGSALTYYLASARAVRKRLPSGRYADEHGLLNNLRTLNVLNNKHIPDLYKTASLDQRWSLLHGLMDTDGYCGPKGDAEFTSIHIRLAADVVELMRSLGLKPRLHTGRAKINGEDKGPKYRVNVSTSQKIFGLARKHRHQIGGYRPDLKNRYVVSIKKVDSVPVRCIQVDSPSHLYLAGRDYITTHNTSFGPWWLWHEIDRCGAGDYLAVTSSYDLFKLKMLPALRETFENVLGIGRYWAGDRVMELRENLSPEGKFLAQTTSDKMWGRIVLRSAQSGAGLESASAQAAWLDECGQDEFTLEAWDAVLRRLSLSGGRVLGTSTPYNMAWMYEEVYKRWKNGDKDYHVVQADSTINPLFPKKEFEERKRKTTDWKFNMFYRGKFVKPASLIYGDFDSEIHECKPIELPTEWPRYVGIDPGPVNTGSVWLALDPDTQLLYLYRETLEGNMTSRQHAFQALQRAKNERVLKWTAGNPSEHQSRWDWSDNGVPLTSPAFSDVETGIDKVISLLKENRLRVFNTCRLIIDEFGSYSRETDESGMPTDTIKQKRKYHLLDALRYCVAGLPNNTRRYRKVYSGAPAGAS